MDAPNYLFEFRFWKSPFSMHNIKFLCFKCRKQYCFSDFKHKPSSPKQGPQRLDVKDTGLEGSYLG